MQGIKIIANGFEEEIPHGTTVGELLELLREPARPDMIVEVNRRFIHLKDYPSTVIEEGDRVEVIHLDIGG